MKLLCPVAGHLMAAEATQARHLFFTPFGRIVATGVEVAASRQIHGVRNLSFQEDRCHLTERIRLRDSRHQCFGIRVHRILEQSLFVCLLNNLPQVHYDDPVAYMLHNAQIVGNKKVCDILDHLKLLEQVYDLGLHRHVKSRYRFITYHKLRVHCQCSGNSDTLPLSSGEGMGETP